MMHRDMMEVKGLRKTRLVPPASTSIVGSRHFCGQGQPAGRVGSHTVSGAQARQPDETFWQLRNAVRRHQQC